LFGNGDGSFHSPIIHDLGSGGASDVHIGDLDGDGLGDTTVSGYWGAGIHVLPGDGGYQNYPEWVLGHMQTDVNKDHYADIVFGKYGGNVGVFLNQGNGTFGSATLFDTKNGAFPQVADFNRDRKTDIVTAGNGTVQLLLGNGDGSFQPYQSFASNAEYVSRVSPGNLTLDRYPDLVVTDGKDSAISVLINDQIWAPPIPPPPYTTVAPPRTENGRYTLTHPLLPGSPAIDTGDNIDAPEWDQRGPGFPRIVNGTIDIGAFEVQSSPIPPSPRPGIELLALVLATADLDSIT
jgi:hypothetical protein